MTARHVGALIFLAAALAACGEDKPASQNAAPAAPEASVASVGAAPAPPSPQPADIPGGMISKAELASAICFFTPQEIQNALGFAVSAGKPNVSMLEAYGSASCRYEGSDNVLQINMFWASADQVEATRQSQARLSAGEIDRLTGDADGAFVQYQKELGGALHYMRRNVMVEIRPMSWREDNAKMKAGLLALRRAP
jgi:hypothetical protein